MNIVKRTHSSELSQLSAGMCRLGLIHSLTVFCSVFNKLNNSVSLGVPTALTGHVLPLAGHKVPISCEILVDPLTGLTTLPLGGPRSNGHLISPWVLREITMS